MSSVCLSVTLVDQDHVGWKSWKLIARTISPTPSLFVAQRGHPPARRGAWGHFGETRGGEKTRLSLTIVDSMKRHERHSYKAHRAVIFAIAQLSYHLQI